MLVYLLIIYIYIYIYLFIYLFLLYNEAMHHLFIDFKKAYDSLRREILYNILTIFYISLTVHPRIIL